jgi:hypothetical protein
MEDFNAGGELLDQGTVNWRDTCDGDNSRGDPSCDFFFPTSADDTLNCNCVTVNTPDGPGATDLESGCTEPQPVVCNDGNACTTEECNTVTGECDTTSTVTCDDGNACTTEECNTVTGECDTTSTETCDDGDACTTEECNTVTGECETTSTETCDDGDDCTEDSCDPETGECVFEPLTPEEAPECFPGAAICRTPGFWATHGGEEKNRSINITQAVIDSVGGLNVCGVTIDNTEAGNDTSAIEAMCVAVKGVSERQLVRQLTAAALNCVMSGGDSDCVGGPIEDLFADCNAACVGDPADHSINECIDEIDCFNNGGTFADGNCTFNPGICSDSLVLCDVDNDQCAGGAGDVCVPDPSPTCHEQELCQVDEEGEPIEDGLCFIPPGPAGSSGECNEAKKNDIFVGDY